MELLEDAVRAIVTALSNEHNRYFTTAVNKKIGKISEKVERFDLYFCQHLRRDFYNEETQKQL